VLLCPNHRSFWDPPFAGASVRRPIHYLAKEELFTTFKPFGWLIRRLNAVPLRREASPLSALRRGLSILGEGRVLLVFPEGTRNKTKATLLPLKEGAALLAVRSGAPIVPAFIAESRGKPWRWVFRLRCPEVRFGPPLDPRTYPEGSEGINRLTRDLRSSLLRLSGIEKGVELESF
jgi:1-acyl-sn-glycerol-3-phosphate acyltransferase